MWSVVQNVFRDHQHCVQRPAEPLQTFRDIYRIPKYCEFGVSTAFQDAADHGSGM